MSWLRLVWKNGARNRRRTILTVVSLAFSLFLITFNFSITGSLVVAALVLSGFLGVLGGLFPARWAARLPIIEALRRE